MLVDMDRSILLTEDEKQLVAALIYFLARKNFIFEFENIAKLKASFAAVLVTSEKKLTIKNMICSIKSSHHSQSVKHHKTVKLPAQINKKIYE